MFKPVKLILIILPLFILLMSFYQKSEMTNYHMYSSDPEYAYLFNGMTICNGITPSHVIGPGTPLQALSAIVIKVVHLFRTTNDTLNVDVMKNPDLYCSAINTSIIIILSLSLLIAGLVVFYATKNILAGLFLQLIPFSHWVLLDLNSRIMVESLIISAFILLIAFIVLYIQNANVDEKKWFDKYIFVFAIFIGFIASLKFVYLPIAILPFLILEGAKRKLSYTLLTIVVFFTFSFPILFHWVAFRDWYIGNFFHSGMYGSGESSIIDLDAFIQNITYMSIRYKLYATTFIAATVFFLLYFIPYLKLKKKNDRDFNAFLGCYFALFILTLLVAKQFKEYYMTVNFLLIVPVWYLIIKMLSRSFKLISSKYAQIAALIVMSFFIWNNGPKLVFDYHSIRMDRDKDFRESLGYVENSFNSSMPVLLISDYYGAPFQEYGVFFAMGWTNPKMGEISALDLRKLYPNIYFYNGWNKTFNQWASSHSYIDLLKKYGTITFYSGDKVVEKSLSGKLHGINRQLDTKWKVTKAFDKIGQAFYEVQFDTIAHKINEYACDAEKRDSSSINFINVSGQLFEGGTNQNADCAKSGVFSVKLLKEQYGFTCSLSEVQKGEHYQVEVWRYMNGNNNSALVIQSINEGELYLNTSSVNAQDGNWEKLTLNFIVPDNLHNKDIRIYCWNFDDAKAAYFDDFTIKRTIE